jgi:hypothetical protein
MYISSGRGDRTEVMELGMYAGLTDPPSAPLTTTSLPLSVSLMTTPNMYTNAAAITKHTTTVYHALTSSSTGTLMNSTASFLGFGERT